jgi:membrane-associated phospholipid phosphatase
VIVLAPGSALWNLAQHASWLTSVVVVVTQACVIATPLLLLLAWPRPSGLRCSLAAAIAVGLVVLARHGITAISFVPRPFTVFHFDPLYPHPPNSAFPSATTGYFAAAAVPALLCWRKLGWVVTAITAEVAFGCVYVGVHYVTDVVAGAAIGAACGAVAWLMLGFPPVARLIGKAEGALGRIPLPRRRTLTDAPEVSRAGRLRFARAERAYQAARGRRREF